MRISGNSILITGGASGIGLSIAKKFLKEGNQVLICGRSQAKLEEAKKEFPELDIFKCDISSEKERTSLLSYVQNKHPNLNILVNNAGVLSFMKFTQADRELFQNVQKELDIDLLAPIQLSLLFLPDLLNRKESVIMNVTSGLAYVPMAVAPIYCAAKAGLHSFSQSLRIQLQNTSVRVIEVLPPAVDTEMAKKIETQISPDRKMKKISPQEVADQVLDGLKVDCPEIRIGQAKGLYFMSRLMPDTIRGLLNK